jgi:succinate dehydrogenase / fumarate reductase flavoprotein subunit
MSESLRNDGRVWVPQKAGRQTRRAARSPKASGTTSWSASTPASATWCRATLPRATPSSSATRARGWGATGLAVYLDFADAIKRDGRAVIERKYGNLFEMYEKITGEDPYTTPMMIYPAVHYTMGGLWVDYNLMSIFRASSSSAKPTSPTTAPTAWAPAP